MKKSVLRTRRLRRRRARDRELWPCVLRPVHLFDRAHDNDPTERADPTTRGGYAKRPVVVARLVQKDSGQSGRHPSGKITKEILHANPPADHFWPGYRLRDGP